MTNELDTPKTEARRKSFLLKAQCPDCEAIIRITQKWIDKASARGGLRCPVCGAEKPMVVEEKP
jgi:ribosomal protein S27E